MLRPRLTAIAALSALAMALTFTSSALAAPTMIDARDGACTGTEGVTVVVDTGPPRAVLVRCVFGTPTNGLDALKRGYDVVVKETDWGPQVCRVAGQGTADCSALDTWVYWASKGSSWSTASAGATVTTPQPGDVDAWSLIPDYNAWPGDVPRVAPHAVAITSPSTISVVRGDNATIEFSIAGVGTTAMCQIDTGAWTSCTTATTHVAAATTLGTHTVTVRATDSWNNASLASTTFTAVPAIVSSSTALTGPHAATIAAHVTTGDSALQVHVEYTHSDDAAAVRTASSDVAAATTTTLSFKLGGLAAGTTFRYRVVTVGVDGTVAGSWSTLALPRAAGRFEVTTRASFLRRGTSVRMDIDGLAPAERFTVRLRSMRLKTGTANAAGHASVMVHVGARARLGRSMLIVTGSRAHRTGRVPVTVTRPQKLRVVISRRSVSAGGNAMVTTSGLVAGEPVTVRRGSVIVARGFGDYRGRFVAGVAVGTRAGRITLRVTGSHASRRGAAVIRVHR